MPASEALGIRLARRLTSRGDCIAWTGAKRPSGYGVIGGSREGRKWLDSPHRVVLELLSGAPIPPNVHVDHLCSQRDCVQPAHLQLVSQQENNRRANAIRWHGYRLARPTSEPMTLADLVTLIAGGAK